MTSSNAKGMKRLFLDAIRAAAAEADESRREPAIDDARLLAALRGERPLSPGEQRQVLLSVDLQERIAVLRRAERIKAEDAWAEMGLESTGMTLLAAADDERAIKPVRMTKPLFTIDLIPIDAEGKVWRINIRIERGVLADFFRHTPRGVQLVDSEGEVWVRGKPDEGGLLVGFWERDDDLWDRLHRVSVDLKPL